MKKYLSLLACLSLAFMLTGCATLFGENNRMVQVNSNPQGAEVFVNNMPVGVTPTRVAVASTWSPTMLTFKKPGYNLMTASISNKFQPVTILDILFWPTLIIDAATGDMMKVDPTSRSINVNLPRATA